MFMKHIDKTNILFSTGYLFQFLICLTVSKIISAGVIWSCRCATDRQHLIRHILERHPEAFLDSLGSYVICLMVGIYFIKRLNTHTTMQTDFYTNHIIILNQSLVKCTQHNSS